MECAGIHQNPAKINLTQNMKTLITAMTLAALTFGSAFASAPVSDKACSKCCKSCETCAKCKKSDCKTCCK